MDKPQTEQEAKYQVYLDERKLLVEGEHKSADQFDKTITTLAAGALGLSLVFLEKIAPNPSPKTIVYLNFAWIALVLSLVSILSSFLLSQHGFRRQRKILEDEIFSEDGKKVDKINEWARWTAKLNWFSIAAFIFGAAMLATFSIKNVKHTFKKSRSNEIEKTSYERHTLKGGNVPQRSPIIIRGRIPTEGPKIPKPNVGLIPAEPPKPIKPAPPSEK